MAADIIDFSRRGRSAPTADVDPRPAAFSQGPAGRVDLTALERHLATGYADGRVTLADFVHRVGRDEQAAARVLAVFLEGA